MKRLLAIVALLVATTSARALELSGYVYDADGTPVEGKRIEAFVPVVKTSLGTTVTAKDGAFVLRELPQSVIELVVEEGPSLFVLAGDSGITIDLGSLPETDVVKASAVRPEPAAPARLRGNAVVSGVARVNGKPYAGVPVMLQGLVDRALEPVRVVTNAKGEFRAVALEPLRYAVVVDERVFPRLRAPESRQPFREGQEPFVVDLREKREATTTVDLTTAPIIRGRVVDAEGTAVGRARVHVTPAKQAVPEWMMQSLARTAPDGRYAFPAPELEQEEVVVSVTAPLHSTVRSKPFTLDARDREVNVTIPRMEEVALRVSDRAGKPVAGARVAWVPSSDTTGPEMAEMLTGRAPRTNETGELALHLARDSYDFFVEAKGFQPARATKRVAAAGKVDVLLERAAVIRGRVRRGERGVANVHVNVSGGRSTRRHISVTTDEKGRFEIDGLAPGPYRLMLFQSETMIERTLDVDAPAEVDVPLPPAGTLRGRVVDAATGAPVREFVFSVEPANPEPRTRGGQGVHRGETSDEGTFTATVPVGAYRVSAGATGYTPSDALEVHVTEKEPVAISILLGRGVTISGRVSDERGVPVADAQVMVIGDLERMRRRTAPRVGPGQARTAADGTFTISGVEPGEAQLSVHAAGYVPFRKTLEAEGTAMSVDARLSRGLSISGIVTRGGKPVADAQVSAATAAVGGQHQGAVSGEDGRFVLSGLVPSRYTISAYYEDEHAEVRDVDPAERKEVTITLDPKPRGVIFGTVTGMPPSLGRHTRKAVIVHGSDGGTEAPIDELGNYRVDNAPLGSVQVSAFVESAGRDARSSVRRQVEVLAGQPVRVDLELSGDVRVSGRVTHEGKPLAGVHVGFSGEDGTMATAITREDGAYEVGLPSAGRFHIFARAEQIFDRHFATVRDVRGGETVDIDLREQVIEGTVIDAGTRLPIAGALVTLAPLMSMQAVMSIAGEVPTDAQGRFRLVTAGAGPQRVVATAPGYAHRSLPVNSSTTHYTFELQPIEPLRVRVVDARSGSPLDAHVVVQQQDGAHVPGRMRRTSDGTSFLFSVAPGRYRLTVVVQGYGTRVVDVTAPGTVDVRME